MAKLKHHLRITEIFHSLQGESTKIGLPTIFIRLTGCPLRCHYCDTAYAFKGGEMLSIDDILSRLPVFSCKHICVTGGEPLAQPHCINLLNSLCDNGYHVSIETSGAHCITQIDPRVMIIMDLKTPGSGESHRNMLANLDSLKPTDQIKFVLCHRDDYEWACNLIHEHALHTRVEVLFSPSWDELNPTTLADWMLHDKLPVRFQLQLHKVLWKDAPGR